MVRDGVGRSLFMTLLRNQGRYNLLLSVLFSVAIWIKTDVLGARVLLGYVQIGAVSNGLISGLRII